MGKSATATEPKKTEESSPNDRVRHFDGCPATETGWVNDELRVETYPSHSPKRGTVQVVRCRECGAQTIEEDQ